MRRPLLAIITLAACGGTGYRTELVGQGNGTVAPRASVAAANIDVSADATGAPGVGGVQLAQGNYELAMRFDIPRAQVVDWRVTCPGVDLDGQVGETLEQYRARRSVELTRERDEQRARGATAASLVLGAATNTNVDIAISGGAPVLPSPADIGRGTLVASARVITSADGVCTLAVTTEDAHEVRASFAITRIRDLAAEDRMRTIAAREGAVKARGSISAQLVTAGANPAAHDAKLAQQRADESARAQTQLDARVAADAELRARAEFRARLEAAALEARHTYLAYLSGRCNADPAHRNRIADDERRRREANLVAYASLAQRRDQLALGARADLVTQLLRWGAKPRPPMPAPKPEDPGTAPFDGAEWTAGYWSWESGAWAWTDGGWSDPTMFDDNLVGFDATLGIHDGGAAHHPRPAPGVRDHRKTRDRVVDHRDLDNPPAWKPSSRDASATTRDHRSDNNPDRSSSRSTWAPSSKDDGAKVRDHRDDDKKDDDKPRVRDHR